MMKPIATAFLIAFIAQALPLAADSIRIEHGYLSITVERGEQPYKIESASFGSASEAARFLAYLDQKWPGESRPTIVVEYKDKAVPEGDEKFEAALARIEESARWRVIRMPSPRGAIPDSWSTLSELRKKWTEQDGVDISAVALEAKSGGKGNSIDGAEKKEEGLPKTWFPIVDGIFYKGEFIDLNSTKGERLHIRYGPISDSGVELERVNRAGKVVWRYQVAPLVVSHSKYNHEVRTRIEGGNILVTSIGSETISEVIDLKAGTKVSRSVHETKR